MSDIAAIKARREAVTPGVWDVRTSFETLYGTKFDNPSVWSGDTFVCDCGTGKGTAADAAFIAAAPADIDTLLAEVERLTAALHDDAATKLGDAMLDAVRLRNQLAAANDDLAYLRSYVHALEIYVPEASRRVAAGEARQQGEQQGEDVPQAQAIMRSDAYRPQGA